MNTTLEGIKQFHDNNEIGNYPNLAFTFYTRAEDLRHFRIVKGGSLPCILEIFSGSTVLLNLL